MKGYKVYLVIHVVKKEVRGVFGSNQEAENYVDRYYDDNSCIVVPVQIENGKIVSQVDEVYTYRKEDEDLSDAFYGYLKKNNIL